MANTPDIYKDEFKNRAAALTGQYLQFSLDVAPQMDDSEKDQYLEMLLDQLIKPIREQPSMWGTHARHITDSSVNWEKIRTAVPRPQNRRESEPPHGTSQPYPDYHPQYPRPPQVQNTAPNHGYPPPPSPYYRAKYPQQSYPDAPGNQSEERYYRTPGNYDITLPYQEMPPPRIQSLLGPSEPAGFQSKPVLPEPFTPFGALAGAPIALHRPTPIQARAPIRDENVALRRSPNDIGSHTPYNIYSDPPPRRRIVQKPGPITPAKQRLMDLARAELRNIRLHPARQMQPLPQYSVAEDNDSMKMDAAQANQNDSITNEHSKRPHSVGSNDNLTQKRKRTDGGVQPVTHNRSTSREQMYNEVAKEHVTDEHYLSKEVPQTSELVATTPIQPDDGGVVPSERRPPLRRSKSRAQIGLEEDLTPGIRELMSPKPFMRDLTSPPPREGSPDRMLWRKGRPPMGGYVEFAPPPVNPRAYSQIVPNQPPPRRVPSHIPTVNSTPASSMATPPRGNDPVTHSDEYLYGNQRARPIFRHIRPLEECEEVRPTVKRAVVSLPTSASEMPGLMKLHDEFNQASHVENRDFYVHTRTAMIANASKWSRTVADGTITLGRFFNFTREELIEIKEYVKFMAGHETTGPRTMIRLVCRAKNGENGGSVNHAWPVNTTVILNGKNLMTTMASDRFSFANASTFLFILRLKI